jgi:metal-dependent amidase/aminoacylase/carboxypeptidase family protein
MGTGPGFGLHHPKYNFNDEAIPAGCSYWAQLVETGMPAT